MPASPWRKRVVGCRLRFSHKLIDLNKARGKFWGAIKHFSKSRHPHNQRDIFSTLTYKRSLIKWNARKMAWRRRNLCFINGLLRDDISIRLGFFQAHLIGWPFVHHGDFFLTKVESRGVNGGGGINAWQQQWSHQVVVRGVVKKFSWKIWISKYRKIRSLLITSIAQCLLCILQPQLKSVKKCQKKRDKQKS